MESKSMIGKYGKLCKIAGYHYLEQEGESLEDKALKEIERRKVNLAAIPNEKTLDAVYLAGRAGDLTAYAATINATTQEELKEKLTEVVDATIRDAAFSDKKTRDTWAVLSNFHNYCNNLQRRGRVDSECSELAEVTWNATTAPRNRERKLKNFFTSQKPDLDKFCAAAEKIKTIYNFSNGNIDALRYFVCQCKFDTLNNKRFDSSLNKSLYFWSKEKKTGKTSLARLLTCALNGDDDFQNSGQYMSTYRNEIGFDTHDLPRACVYNAVLLDEAMPKDARKSYGALKSTLTDSSFNYNPKYKQARSIPAHRNYICTSNDSATSFIQDESERRFCEIEFKGAPVKTEFNELYKIICDFVLYAPAENDFLSWYNTFEELKGVAAVEAEDAQYDIYRNFVFLVKENENSSITARQIACTIYKNEPTREQKSAILSAMNTLFPDCTFSSNARSFSLAKLKRFSLLMDANGNIISKLGE